MKIDVVKNASRNIVFAVIKKWYMVILSFVMRTMMIHMLGIEYAGLNGLFSSLLNVMSLAELGVGSAIVYCMYKPIAENDHNHICELLQEYKKCYRIIGLVILVIGLLILPFLESFVNGEIPADINIYTVSFESVYNSLYLFLFCLPFVLVYRFSALRCVK